MKKLIYIFKEETTMIRGSVFLSNDEVSMYKEYCEANNIKMFKVDKYEYVFIMKSKKLAKFMRFAKEYNCSKVRKIELAD